MMTKSARTPGTLRTARKVLGNQDGISVVEMLLVFTLLAVAMLPLASVQFESRREVAEARRESQAMQIALTQIERARMLGFGEAAGDSLHDPPFTAVTSVVPDPANPFLEEVQVRVTWSRGSEERELVVAGKQAPR